MAKFTVFFKDAPIHSAMFDSGVIHIGRDNTNDIVIDSLAIAPAHAVVSFSEENVTIKQLSEEFPIFVNGVRVKDSALKNNDKITVGKHIIFFTTAEANLADAIVGSGSESDIDGAPHKSALSDANLQITGGQYIGRLIPLKKAMTRL